MDNYIPSILFIHGFGQSGKIFSHRLKNLSKKIYKKFDKKINYIYPDAPIILPTQKEDEIERGWMQCNNPDIFYGLNTVNYIGLESSIQYIYDIGDKDKSIEAIFTFSQGTCLLFYIIMLHLYQNDIYNFKVHFPNLKCFVFVSGFIKPYPENDIFNKLIQYIKPDSSDIRQLDIPSLHVYGINDNYVNYEKSKEVLKFFKEPEIFEHEGKHFVPSNKDDCIIFEEFLYKYIHK